MPTTTLNILSLQTIRDKKIDLLLLPWGATEPHNLHLPYGTDTILSNDIAVEAAQKIVNKGVTAIILPPVPFGSQNPGQTGQPLCIHARYETQKAILSDIIASMNRQHFDKLVLINGHGGNSFKNMIRDLAVDFPKITIVVVDWFAIVPQSSYFENKDDHAGEMETSVMLHFHPEWVLPLSQAGDGIETPFNIAALNEKTGWTPRHWNLATSDTGIGNPKASTAEKGAKYVDAVTDKIAILLEQLAKNELYPHPNNVL
ncbi:creatininase family protein [Microbacter margulisiae]|uniref:Creatinine amidohydrolase n=1 Tax=Microbacter margulisiae TaxID=1350067 RepID=A0A7W5DQH4_9PORP|nr:creatininase family protein [Microbacter margulisiae]MBB3186878.1 creatinine amidohydrolase [Microbacter margulisiae]